MVRPRPRRASIAGRRIGAVGVLIEEDTQVIALGVPIIDIADGVIDLGTRLGIVSPAGEEFILGRRPTKHPRRGRGHARQVQRQEEQSSGRHDCSAHGDKTISRLKAGGGMSFYWGHAAHPHPPSPREFVSTCLLVAKGAGSGTLHIPRWEDSLGVGSNRSGAKDEAKARQRTTGPFEGLPILFSRSRLKNTR